MGAAATTMYLMSAGPRIMPRQLKRGVPLGMQFPGRWRWPQTSTYGFTPRSSRGHQRSTLAASRSATRGMVALLCHFS